MERCEKITISLPKNLVEAIDEIVRKDEKNESRSKVIKEALWLYFNKYVFPPKEEEE